MTGANLQCEAVTAFTCNYLHTKGMTSGLVFQKLRTISSDSLCSENISSLSSVVLNQLAVFVFSVVNGSSSLKED